MASEERPEATDDALISDLSEAERSRLEQHRHHVKDGEVIWIEPGGEVRREPVDRVYYIQTDRGVFRVSRITHRVVEV